MNHRNQDLINKKCGLIESLGFEVWHNDSDSSFQTQNTTFEGFDFSATAPDVQSILYTALTHVYNLGLEQGKSQVRQDIKAAFGIGE